MSYLEGTSLFRFSVLIVSLFFSNPLFALGTSGQATEMRIIKEMPGKLLAKNKRGERKKIIQGEARAKATQTSIDFDAASIDGERRAPVGVQVGGSKNDQGYDLINLRLRWHPEMIKSTSNLETGKDE